ncbi:MAG: site-specific DNA-methyltransferase [Candidatus Melainabacteria bacterium]|nr:site-specific DNA-methyltransferase [Candidatus Melainabacteria bacterium]
MRSINKKLNSGVCYSTKQGKYYLGSCEAVLQSAKLRKLKGKVKLIFTSPPFPLNRKKRYGNLVGEQYLKWLSNLALLFSDFLAPHGSIVIELGNAWTPGSPTVSTLPMEALLKFKQSANLHLCQEFICYNPARLPSPAQWVTVDRIRVKDAFTRIWWLSKTPYPDANNKRILVEYSKHMKKLLKDGKYNSGIRPSEHKIGKKSFCKNNGGAIPPNVLTVSNVSSKNPYLDFCRSKNIIPHPARMPVQIAEFFVKFLTKKNDIVLDPFGGSNVTGFASEELKRRWVSIELNRDYITSSLGRFSGNGFKVKENKRLTKIL